MSVDVHLCLVAAFMIIVTQAIFNETCRADKDCDADECCEIPKFLILSRKRSPRLKAEVHKKNGTCKKYKQESKLCDPFEKFNGACGCLPGLKCRRYEITNTTDELPSLGMRTRRDMALPKPGCSLWQQCKPPGGDC